MSERKRVEEDDTPANRSDHDEDDFDDAVMAADDTGMVRNEAQIIEVEESEGGA